MSVAVHSTPPFPAADGAAVFPSLYAVEDFGDTPEGLPLLPVALNDAGQAAGYGQPPERQAKNWNIRGYVWKDGALGEAGAAHGAVPVTGLSNNGITCGLTRNGTGVRHAWVSHLGDFGARHWPDSESAAVAVNAEGMVTGQVAFAQGDRVRRRVFLVNPFGESQFLPAPGGGSAVAAAINDRGEVLLNGSRGFFEINSQAALWRDGLCTVVEAPTSGGSWGAALTPAGRVAGRLLTASGNISAFLHEDGRTYDLNPGPGHQSEALALNDHRVVVGRMMDSDGRREAFRWTPADGMRPLADFVADADGWEFQRAVAVNAAGLVAGVGRRDNETRGFLLRPVA
jgi:uncharacterized membrane protein